MIEELLGTWKVLPGELEQLRALHASALNVRVAHHCAQSLAGRDGALAERLERHVEGIAASRWTAPELAYAYYVALPGNATADIAYLETIVDVMERVASTSPPPIQFGVPAPAPSWVDFALRTFEDDARRDGHTPDRLELSDAPGERDEILEGLGVLREAWPEMAAATDCLVRVVLSCDRFGGSGSLPHA